MGKKQLYRITESDIKTIIESAVKRVLREGSVETSDLTTWDKIKEMIGSDMMLQMIWNYMNSDQVRDFIDYAKHELSADGYSFRDDNDSLFTDDDDDYEEDEEMY